MDAHNSGLPGRPVTLVALAILATLCLGIARFTFVVHRIQRAREATSRDWRVLADLLDRDYRRISELLALSKGRFPGSSDDAPAISDGDPADRTAVAGDWDVEPGEFLRWLDEFRTEVDGVAQRSHAEKIEQSLARIRPLVTADLSASEEIRQAVRIYNRSLERERLLLESGGGRLVRVFLSIPVVPEFDVERLR